MLTKIDMAVMSAVIAAIAIAAHYVINFGA
jgi:hypothetical protein